MEISGRKEMDGMEDRGEMVCLARMDDVGNEEGEEEERKSVQTGSNREGEVGRGEGGSYWGGGGGGGWWET